MTGTSGHRTVLVVEDNGDNRVIMKALLEHAGYTVAVALDGPTGLQRARSLHPDIIVMDIALPGLDGGAVAEHLKSDVATSTIPIVALSALALPEDERRIIAAGVDCYLRKPAQLSCVLREIERLLPR